MFTAEPRVLVPTAVARGEVFTVKALCAHPMETGLRHDSEGKIIPRRIINKFVCRYADVEVFSADFHESVAANPYIEFDLEATASGVLEFVWEEDEGGSVRLEQTLVVS